jgi:hypothetical protein
VVRSALRRATKQVAVAARYGGTIKAQRSGAAALDLATQPNARLARSNVTGVMIVGA